MKTDAASPWETPVTLPTWLRDVETAVVTHAQVLLYGNVRDQYLLPAPSGGMSFFSIKDALWSVLTRIGYEALVSADAVEGLTVVGRPPASGEWEPARIARELLGKRLDDGPSSLESLGEILRDVTAPPARQRVAIVLEYAARLVRDLPRLDATEHVFFSRCERLANTTLPLPWLDGTARYNPVIWVVQHERELPTWLLASGEGIRRIAVPAPELDDRRRAAELLARALPEASADPDAADGVAERFAEQTVGMTLRSMKEIVRLGRSRVGPVSTVDDAVRCYRVGIRENPWRTETLRRRIATAQARVSERVRGQPEAVRHSLDIVIRSVMGLSGAQTSTASARPRGVMFFAGPTGVGKTELAKALTEVIFGEERAYIRFDMSEFSAEHAADRLAGAPPGYLGHDAGGELTNAVRERPFSLILFDEIEKAHRRVLDKFLQILDDGRLTDGSGSTVYFSEAVIVFTSNLGVRAADRPQDDLGRLVDTPPLTDLDRTGLVQHVSDAVRRHFVEKLQRPELLNRIGDNIVVFNYISPEIATEIFDGQLRRILDRVERQAGVVVEVAPEVRTQLRDEATADLSFGGRGIGSVLESVFVNPLARALFSVPPDRTAITVSRLRPQAGTWDVELSDMPRSDD